MALYKPLVDTKSEFPALFVGWIDQNREYRITLLTQSRFIMVAITNFVGGPRVRIINEARMVSLTSCKRAFREIKL